MTKPVLKIDWATYEAAKYACEHWHYSKCIPKSKLVKIGIWENDKFIGVIIFSHGANNNLSRPYGLKNTSCVELTRVALTTHKSFVSQILSRSIAFLKKKCPGIRLIVSYADKDQKHVGTIYQATNWIYAGIFGEGSKSAYLIDGKKIHPKTIFERYGTRSEIIVRKIHKDFEFFVTNGKHKYLFPLDPEMKKQIMPLAKPYPKCVSSKDIVVSENHSEEGGENPTDTLQIQKDKS